MRFPFWKNETTESTLEKERILPSDVRYALRYKEAQCGTLELQALVDNNFLDEALYLVCKMGLQKPEVHTKLISEFAHAQTDEQIKKVLTNFLAVADTYDPVLGEKLALISRQGFLHWQELYTESAQRLASEDREVFLVAHSVFVGFRAYASAFAASHKTLHILVPDFCEGQSTIVGYSLFPDGTVKNIETTFKRPNNAVIVDDAIHTGATKGLLESFWGNDSEAAPSFEFLLNASE